MRFACPADPFVLAWFGWTMLFSQSSAHSAGPLRPCGLLSLARGPALARALPLALSLALALALALAVALALRLALPLVFALASASFFARRKRQHGPPEEPKSTPGGSPNGLLEASGPEAGPKWPPGLSGAAPGRLLERSWRLLEPSWGALGALLAPLGAVWGSPGDPRRVHGRPFWEVFLEVCPGRLKNQRCLMFFCYTLLSLLFNAFLGRLLSSLGLRRRGRAP